MPEASEDIDSRDKEASTEGLTIERYAVMDHERPLEPTTSPHDQRPVKN